MTTPQEKRKAQREALLARIQPRHLQAKPGKLSARERIELLFDEGTFVETDAFRVHNCRDFDMPSKSIPGDGVITGYGLVQGRNLFAFAQDSSVFGGALSKVVAEKICKIYDLAMKTGAPIVGLCDSGGARIQEGVASLAGYTDIFCRNALASGLIPQFSVIMGPSAGGAVYSPALTDFVLMVRHSSYMFLTGPDVIKTVTHEEVSMEELGGADTHASKSGVAHFACDNDVDAIMTLKRVLGFLPQNNREVAPFVEMQDASDRREPALKEMIPVVSSQPYDVRDVIKAIVDKGDFCEVQEAFAQNVVVGFARMAGASIGIVANQPQVLAGALDINASDKASRFVRLCDCFNIPILTLVDVPGFLPGTGQEHGGVIRHGAKMLYAYAEATVPKVTVILRKAYGGAYCVMGSKHLRGDCNFALPTAEIAVMGAQGAVGIIMRHALKEADDKKTLLKTLTEEYALAFQSPYKAAELGYIDEVIFPEDMRPRICQALQMLATKRDALPSKKHGNIPL